MVKQLKGLHSTGGYQIYAITAPYASEKYVFAGSKTAAAAAAKKAFKGWSYSPQVRKLW